MRRKIKPKTEDKDLKYHRNPLLKEDFRIMVKRYKDGSFITNGRIATMKVIEVDNDASSKVYISPDNRRSVAMLSTRAKEMFLWILFELEGGKDWLWINRKRYMKENNITSINTVKAAIAELCRYFYIYPHERYKEIYWINPKILFNGSRTRKYRMFVKYTDGGEPTVLLAPDLQPEPPKKEYHDLDETVIPDTEQAIYYDEEEEERPKRTARAPQQQHKRIKRERNEQEIPKSIPIEQEKEGESEFRI